MAINEMVSGLLRILSKAFVISYLFRFNRGTVKDGFKSVKNDELDAFIYDATVLEYLVGQDDECDILTVGNWYAMTGYGVAFPKGSVWVGRFNEYLMRYRENGDLERMQRFWFTGACEPRKRRRTSSKPLALAQFMSAFLLLGIGIAISGLLLVCERVYFGYLRHYLTGVGYSGFCALISSSMADSLKKDDFKGFRKRVSDGNDQDQEYTCLCDDPQCEMSFQAVNHQLQRCNKRIETLQKALLCSKSTTIDKRENKLFPMSRISPSPRIDWKLDTGLKRRGNQSGSGVMTKYCCNHSHLAFQEVETVL